MNIGDRFNTAEEIKEEYGKYSYSRNFKARVERSDSQAVILGCAAPGCQFLVRFFKFQDRKNPLNIVYNYKLTSGNFTHNCNCADATTDNRLISSKQLIKEFQNIVLDDISIPISKLIFLIREKTGAIVNYLKAYRIKYKILNSYVFNFTNCYKFIFSFINYINIVNGYGLFERNTNNSFKRAFIGLPYSKRIINFVRRFISLDGCHIKNKYKNTLIMAVCLDANNNIIILAYAIVSIENLENWSWFLFHLRILLGFASYESFVFISDRDKGLKNSLAQIFPESTITICLRHFIANIKKQVKNKHILMIFWKCAKTFNPVMFTEYYGILRDYNSIFQLICESTSEWARSQINLPRFGHYTSNISESINNAVGKSRKKSDLDLILDIYSYIVDKFYSRKIKASMVQTKYSPYCTKKLQKNLDSTGYYNFRNLKNFEGIITRKKRNEDGTEKEFYVDLANNFCSCGHFFDNQMPCFHATKLISLLGLDSSNYITNYYSTFYYQSTYCENIFPILRQYLSTDKITNHPPIVTKKGRPKSTNRRKSYLESIKK